MPASKLTDEAGRQAALERYGVLDSGPEQAFEKITALVKSVLQVPICAVSLIDRDRQWFKSIQGLDVRETARDVAFCDHTIRAREPLLIADATADPRFAGNALVTGPPYIRSYAGVPLQTPEGFNLGALCIIDTKPRSYTAEHIALLGQFADLVVRELESRNVAIPDPLTGTLSRRGFDDAMRGGLIEFQTSGETCSLLICDIDNFGAINESCGRAIGNTILQSIVGCLRATLRSDDAIGRLGGDTFGILLPRCTAYEAVAYAERLRNRIASLVFTGPNPPRVTASFGIATLQRGDTCDIWIGQAKGAVFAAKRRGRNQSVSADKLR